MRRFVVLGPAIVVLLTSLSLMFVGPFAVRRLSESAAIGRAEAARKSLAADDILGRLNAAVEHVAQAVQPSLVHIDVDIPPDDMTRGRLSSGAGWVWDNRGHVVTNAHVVRGASYIRVQTPDGRVTPAEIVKADIYTDIAVLRVDSPEGLLPIERASGVQPLLGQRVFAFGSPFGFKFSMSEGIISGLGRDPLGADEPTGMTNYIQTDAAVNPGNSGGPLVDSKARLIGMNVAIATGAGTQNLLQGQSAGISFAIPLATIEPVVTQIVRGGEVSRGYLGIRIPPAEEPIISDTGFVGAGVRIPFVEPDGPAARAGLLAGDIVTHFNDVPIRNPAMLRSAIGSLFPGDRARIRVWRHNAEQEVQVVLGEFPIAALASQSVIPALLRYGMQLAQDDEGLYVRAVLADSAAAQAGFVADLRIIEAADRSVATGEDFFVALMRADFLLGKPVPILALDESSGATQRLVMVLPR